MASLSQPGPQASSQQSLNPQLGLIQPTRDPTFWHRFSLAAHQQAEIGFTSDIEKNGSSTTVNSTTPWLSKQKKKRRKYWIFCWVVLVAIVVLCATLAGVLSYLNHPHS